MYVFVETIEIDQDEAECFCPKCGKWLVNIQFDGKDKNKSIVICSGKRILKKYYKACRYVFYVEKGDA